MTKSSEYRIDNSNSNSIKKPPFSIVHIACNEVNTMSGAKDRSNTCGGNGSGEGEDKVSKEYECMGRIAKIPLVESTALVMSNFYTSVKKSHCMVQTVFENVEEGWSKSADAVSPVTSKIEETLETPLRVIDNAACVGLDFIEEKVPSVKLPPEKIYENSKEYMNRRVLLPVVEFTCNVLENVKNKVSQYAIKATTGTADDEERNVSDDNDYKNTELVDDEK